MIASIKEWIFTYKPSHVKTKLDAVKKEKSELEKKLREEFEKYENAVRQDGNAN